MNIQIKMASQKYKYECKNTSIVKKKKKIAFGEVFCC